MRMCFLYILILAFPFWMYSQDEKANKAFTANGVILNQTTNQPIPFAHIIDYFHEKGFAADEKGEFSIIINQNDTLTFSAIGFSKRYICFSDSVIRENVRINVFLNPEIYLCKEVTIFPYKNYTEFKKAVVDFKLHEEDARVVDAVNRIKESVGSVDYSKYEKSGISGPITALYMAFSREGKELRKYAELLAEDQYREKLSIKYNKEIVRQATGIKDEKQLDEFMKFCKMEDSFIESATEYQIMLAINACYQSFIKEGTQTED